ncbi:hypothetical protein BST97_09615 [Nonlabens spongiae]|uniref:Uncharacterized protein n=1 Tax=Nonlabens spongiae TaxID=331648 RepID=A0A1W6MKX4_9FLAO|nr:hypothetical protein BST97_09615 [Nonlabens spongiae]
MLYRRTSNLIPCLTHETTIQKLEEWIENDLIRECEWTEGYFEVGLVLTYEHFKIDDDNRIRDDFYRDKKCSLVPESEAYLKWLSTD